MPNFRDCTVIKLPSSETKLAVYRKYFEIAKIDPEIKEISVTSFKSFWNVHCPYVTSVRLDKNQSATSENSSRLILSFYCAQNVSCTSSAQQVGEIYFNVPRKCGSFGIHNEATHKQTNFLIVEADSTGKGSNSVISMLVYY